jgi:hypothetical protein
MIHVQVKRFKSSNKLLICTRFVGKGGDKIIDVTFERELQFNMYTVTEVIGILEHLLAALQLYSTSVVIFGDKRPDCTKT